MAPCVPQALLPILDCGTGVGTLSWASSAGAETYEVTAVSGDGNPLAFSTNITSGFLSELLCGQQYQITVRAINRQCRSVLSSPAYLSSVPCVPQNVVSELDCSFNFITIRWNVSHGAASYLVVANGPEGPVTACNTTAQQCRLQTLHCSSSYNVRVIAVNQQCNTSGSSILRINTVPCVPSHVQGSVNCTTGDLSVSWDPSVGAISYAAVAQTSGGYASVCNSTGTACVFSDLLCGMNYSLAVSATDGTCNTAQSQPVVLSTVSCKPQNASAQLNCDTNSAVVSWELSDNIKHHTVQATGSDGHRIDCSSSDHSCTLSGMHCGQSYNITVTALGGVCDNGNMHLFLQSAPCAPSNVQTSLHCDISNGGVVSVSWVQANGAESYTAVAESNNGHSYSCNTTAASCDLQELQCGQIYNVSVYSLAHGCGRVKSTTSQVQTAPCPPQNVSAIVQCDLGSVLVSWNPAVDASQFRVELESESTGTISSCNSTNTQCSIVHLPCGERFNLSVVALRGSCQSQPISDLSISSAPCIPQGVTGTVDCVTNSAWVSWNVDNGAESYTVQAVRDDGHNSTCSSSNSTCNVPDLGCGRSYTFHVTASNAACVSPPSNSFQLETAPCALSSILVVAECHSSVIIVQWQRARSGNSLYIATAEDQDRSLLSCNSSASSCNFTHVQCDKEYTIIVAASANQCSSLRSPPYKIRTAPCQPSSVQADVDCQSKDVFVSWDPSYVAQSYLLTVVGRNGDLKTCNTSDNNCTLTDLHCSNTYYVSVLASNENCTSLPSANITFQMVPCEPANLTANIQCGNSSSASLSWVGSTGAVVYTGLAQSQTGTTVYCETTHTSCTLEGLVCGTVYNFTVQAKDGFCNSSLSEPQTKGAAPCPPAGLRVVPRTVVNDTQILRASWSTVNCPNSEYLLALTGSIQGNSQALFDLASYWTSRRFFEVPLLCGSSYSATISARNSAATSDKSAAITGTTVPCAPLNVTFSASSAEVAWNQSLFATNYTVYGVTSSGRTKLCMTSQLLCSVTNFSSGHIVVTASNTAGESEDSVPVSVTAGRRRR
uniref:Fibronectin type III domain containing 7, related sequence 4 n=1 Tax=Sinocyclocheilus grahami TaxID=75366 RepID=A0A672QZ12_SINGR